MQSELSRLISKQYKVNFPSEIMKLILSFDLEICFHVFFQERCDLQMALTINYISFYDDILDLFRREYYKHSDLNFRIKDRKKLKYIITEIIYKKKQNLY